MFTGPSFIRTDQNMLFIPSDVLDFSEDDIRVVASGPRRPPQGKPAEKNPDSFRRIFSAHKKVRLNMTFSCTESHDCWLFMLLNVTNILNSDHIGQEAIIELRLQRKWPQTERETQRT